MNTHRSGTDSRKSSVRRQSGAALIVAMILLIAVSLVAIGSMNGATLDLIMAGNEQFRSRAFQAAETGIETALLNSAAFDSSKDYPMLTTAVSTGTGNDGFKYGVTRPANGELSPPPSGTSAGTFAAIYFKVTSTGTSDRGAIATNSQELFQVVKSASEFTCKPPLTCAL